MTELTQYRIGARAHCNDGDCGGVIRVVMDPIARIVTHLVVEPPHRQGLGRLVPVDLVDASDEPIRIRCTLAEFERFDDAEATQFLPETVNESGYGAGQVSSLPYFRLGLGAGNMTKAVTYDTVPLGEVAIRRGDAVQATDGEIGRVQGLVVDPRNHGVTHVLLEEGHLWGRKQVAIPVTAIDRMADGIRLTVSKQVVEELPPVEVDPPQVAP